MHRVLLQDTQSKRGGKKPSTRSSSRPDVPGWFSRTSTSQLIPEASPRGRRLHGRLRDEGHTPGRLPPESAGVHKEQSERRDDTACIQEVVFKISFFYFF